ncbi:bifunctional diaminohydroxyphosphoribosylaminopyrimidine deaminase/5-amino-6-(5-phosphoribosylamino)uracil reductase RibD [bacterium]|nr:bifunctional diaminohydroxyphosphoribosylaminopyrimidine deaminase/5-amino-6-(5-phosphoribosylamino)uracil reductase RibD [bacterium]
MKADERWMRRALELAVRGARTAAPNPMVGAVVVKDGVLVGEGYHQRAGEAHAEVAALAAAGEAARGATLYATLEPCCHYGRTGPCTEALIAAGVRRVVAGMRDPYPPVAGKGLLRLREAGIRVKCGVLEDECRRLNRAFFSRITRNRPWVTIKLATTLDGKIATRTGDSKWITSEATRAWTHDLRARVNAILVGIGTVESDDPRLTARPLDSNDLRQPLRIVLDTHCRLSGRERICRSVAEGPVAGGGGVVGRTAAGRRAAGACDGGGRHRPARPHVRNWRGARSTICWSRAARAWPAPFTRRVLWMNTSSASRPGSWGIRWPSLRSPAAC